jgi:glycoside hydrolase-like protein
VTFGIDTFRSRLDRLTAIADGGDFFVWNGNEAPAFAGRNFLVGDHMWAHAEATNASSEPDGARYPLPAAAPSPEHPENLTLAVARVAPIQAPHGPHQRLTRDRGRLYGMIDADAICKRVVAAILAGELDLSEAHLMHIWLSVDPDPAVPFSDDYWAGWADMVNTFVLPITSNGVLQTQLQPFRAGIVCTYVAGDDGKLRPDRRVTDALSVRHRGMNTGQHGFWADFKLWDNAPHDLAGNEDPRLDWSRFDPPTAPILWRFAHGFEKPNGRPAGVDCDIDAAAPTAEPLAFMFATRTWQPNVPTIRNLGFIKEATITNAQSQCLQQTPMPDMNDNNFHANSGHFHVPSGPINFIGRYLRHGVDPRDGSTLSSAEARMLSSADFKLFTIWESTRPLAGMGPAGAAPTMQDTVKVPPAIHQCQHWGRFGRKAQKNIFYFRPDPDGNQATHDDAGTLDGTEAFQYVGDTLKQPPNTPVFFSIDFDPYDLPDASTVPAWAGPPDEEPADWAHDWPAPPGRNEAENWVLSYFTNIKAARDAYFARTDRYYLIGVYAPGGALELLYKQGIVSHFWQAGSSGRTGSHPPRWPWFHLNRWQYQGNVAPICGIQQPDPDADWGDGGLWSLSDPLAVELDQLERRGIVFEFIDYGELVVPPPPPPPPP